MNDVQGDLMDDVQDDLMNDVRLIKLIFPSSLLRKLFPKLVFAEDGCGKVSLQSLRIWRRSGSPNPQKMGGVNYLLAESI